MQMLSRITSSTGDWPARFAALQKSPLFKRWLTKAPFWVNLLCIVLLAQGLAQLTWRVVAPSSKPVAPVSTNTARQQAAGPQRHNLAKLHLFGVAPQGAAPVSNAPIVAPETKLKLVLKGVFASSDPTLGWAIIANANGTDKHYRLGAKVPGGAVLHAVYADRVILKRGGGLETLRLPKEARAGRTAKRTSRSSARSTGPVKRVQAPQRLQKLRDDLLNNPQKIWEQVRIQPVLKGGKVKGYTLNHNDKKLMKELGLRPSDVITAINGMELSDPTVLYGMWEQLANSQELSLTIERKGRVQTIIVHL